MIEEEKVEEKKKKRSKLKIAGAALCFAVAIPAMLTGCSGQDGSNGKDGTKWHSGTEDPTMEIGVEGDFYLDEDDFVLYKKTSTAWVPIGTIKGSSQYTHIAYSKTADKNATDIIFEWEEGYDYIGVVVTDSSVAPTTKSAYNWSLFKGETGATGETGDSTYVHIRYARSMSGQGMQDLWTEGLDYIGIAVSTQPTAPLSAIEYRWSLIKGSQGNSGTNSFVHIMYAKDSQGTDMRETWLAGFDYIGVYTDSNESASNNPNNYEWSKFVGEDAVSVVDMKFAHKADADGNAFIEVTTEFSNQTKTTDIIYTGPTFYVGEVMTLEKAYELCLENGTIVLNKDLNLTAPFVIDKDITLDLNGHTISSAETIKNVDEGKLALISIAEDTNVIITDTAYETAGEVLALEDDCYAVEVNGGNLLIRGGEFTGNTSAVFVKEGNLLVEGGTFAVYDVDKTYVVDCDNSNYTADKATLSIVGGVFEGYNPAKALNETDEVCFVPNNCTVIQSGNDFIVMTIEEAFNMLPQIAGVPVTMYLTDDLVLPEYGVEIGNNVDLTINLNGHTVSGWSGATSYAFESQTSVLRVMAGGKLRVVAGSVIDLEDDTPTFEIPIWSNGGQAILEVSEEYEVKIATTSQPIVEFAFEIKTDTLGNTCLETTTTLEDETTQEIISLSQTQSEIKVDGTLVKLQDAFDAIVYEGKITLLNDIILDETNSVSQKCTLDLAGHKISNLVEIWDHDEDDPNSPKNWSLISVRDNGDLTITGNGIIQALENDCYAVDVRETAKVTIENGKFIGNVSAVYVFTGEAVINGGEFSIQQVDGNGYKLVVNCKDENYKNQTANIIVNGGKFTNFDPSAAKGDAGNFVSAENVILSYQVEENTIYEIVHQDNIQSVLDKLTGNVSMKLIGNVDFPTAVVVKSGVTLTLDLNGKPITITRDNDLDNGGNGVFQVLNGGKLIINDSSKEQTGTINALAPNPWSMALWAKGGEIEVNAGKYTNVGATSEEDSDHFDLVYISEFGHVTINGGTYECEKPIWTLNHKDNSFNGTSLFTVNGGTFIGFDPSAVTTESVKPLNLVAENKVVIKENNIYKVIDENKIQETLDENTNEMTVKLMSDIILTTPLRVNKKVTLDLNGNKISNQVEIWDHDEDDPNSPKNWSLISVRDDGDLTITGNGIIQALENDCYAVDVRETAKVTIENGKFIGNVSALYVFTGEAVINGGEFSIQQVDGNGYKLVVNCQDDNYKNQTANIIVNGGKFTNFDPSAAKGDAGNFVSAEKLVTSYEIEEDIVYEVVEASARDTF